jgi:uncharacterized membrane protein YdjX (TVP38/TMEM64 family)/rhodanese-related sulfurtransferase
VQNKVEWGTRNLQHALLALLLAGAVAFVFMCRDRLDAAALENWVTGAGAAGPLLFMALYALAAVLFLPGSVLTLAGGALFGPVWGTLYNLTGATLGAALAFLVARYLAFDWVQARLGGSSNGRIARLVKGVEVEGWHFVAFTRLVPLFPFNLLNYVLGITRIPLLHYLLASFVFMFPGAIAYTYLGYAGREAVAGGEDLIQKGLITLALLAAAAFLPRLVGRLRERPWLSVDELKVRLDQREGLLLDVRTSDDFDGEQGHIDAALNLPLEDIQRRLDALGDDPERPIAIVCRTDRRSAKAAGLLARHGFSDVQVVRGGMTAWLERGWPVERNPQRSV